MTLRLFSLSLVILTLACSNGRDRGDDGAVEDDGDIARDGDMEPGDDPYPLYPTLDLARVPFHTGSGDWGAQRAIVAPELPRTSGEEVVVSTAQALEAAMGVPGSVVRVDTSIDSLVVINRPEVRDIDLVIPEGVELRGGLLLGGCIDDAEVHRVRIRGDVAGERGGGVIGDLSVCGPGGVTDLVFDGFDMNGGLVLNASVDRVAIVRLRAHTEASFLLGTVSNAVLAGLDIMSSARPRYAARAEGWGIRLNVGTVVVFQNRVQGTRYHKLRFHSRAEMTSLAWVAENVFVDTHEARMLATWFGYNGAEARPVAGLFVHDNDFYAGADMGGCAAMPELYPRDVTYARITGNRIYSDHIAARSPEAEAADGALIDTTTDNVFAAWTAPPTWSAARDPRTNVALPPLDTTTCTSGGPGGGPMLVPACDCFVELPGCPCAD